jgi:type VI secretion system secreted protein VgrG
MAGTHLLNLRVLASEDIADYALLRFDGREAMSEPFDYRLELIAATPPTGLRSWIGKLVEFDVTMTNGDERVFAGRIYETRQLSAAQAVNRIELRVRPAYFAVAYGRATHFIQDRTARGIFEAMTADVPGLVTDITLSPAPPKRSYAVRYDESEFDFLDRLLAQDGIAYFFTYDRGAGTFRHKMHLTNAASAYHDVPGGDDLLFQAGASGSTMSALHHVHRALAGKHEYHGFEVSKLDTPWKQSGEIAGDWGRVYAHAHEDLIGEGLVAGDVTARGGLHDEAYAQEAEEIGGTGDNPAFFAGGRIALGWTDGSAPGRVVLTSVTHSAYDPWMLGQGGGATYANSFTAMDAAKAFRPPAPRDRRRAPGPVMGVVTLEGAAAGEAKIDAQSRVPVSIVPGRVYDGGKPLPKVVWLPVQQQWAHSTHGAQFFPRIGTRVIVDFLYGDPDLPIVVGTMYTPSQKYPFDPASNATQSGWKSVTDKNGSITQNLLFEDKPGAEEIQLYTGRDYRRLIDNDDWGTIKHDQTLIVENDQTETVKHDQKLTVENDQTIAITNNRKIDVTGTEATTIQKTRTTKVIQKSLHESMKEIELKVGPSSIKLTMDKIVITSPQIEIKGTATVKVEAGATLETKAPLAQHNADAMMIIKGGLVMIN